MGDSLGILPSDRVEYLCGWGHLTEALPADDQDVKASLTLAPGLGVLPAVPPLPDVRDHRGSVLVEPVHPAQLGQAGPGGRTGEDDVTLLDLHSENVLHPRISASSSSSA